MPGECLLEFSFSFLPRYRTIAVFAAVQATVRNVTAFLISIIKLRCSDNWDKMKNSIFFGGLIEGIDIKFVW